jgi:hypothetical protein
MLTQFLFRLSARSGSVLRQLGDCARVRVARPASATGARVVRTAVFWLDACAATWQQWCAHLLATTGH